MLRAPIFLRFLAKTVILRRQIYIPVTRDIPGDLVFILTARYIASAMYKPVKRMTILLSLIQDTGWIGSDQYYKIDKHHAARTRFNPGATVLIVAVEI